MLIEALVLTWKQHNFSKLCPASQGLLFLFILEKLSQNKKLVEEDIAHFERVLQWQDSLNMKYSSFRAYL